MTDGDVQSTTRERARSLGQTSSGEERGHSALENIEFACFVFLTFGLACWCVLTWLAGLYVDRTSTEIDAMTIRQAMVLFRAENSGAPCPSVKNLMAEDFLGSWMRTRDGWDNAYRMSCDGHDVLVVSAGPDEMFGTRDDID